MQKYALLSYVRASGSCDMAADVAQLVATLRSLQLDSLSDEECDMLQVGLSAVQQALDERSSSRSHLCSEALRVILPICERY